MGDMNRIVKLITFAEATYGAVDEATETWLYAVSTRFEHFRVFSMDGYQGADGKHYRTIIYRAW